MRYLSIERIKYISLQQGVYVRIKGAIWKPPNPKCLLGKGVI